jgi:glyoxylase-like metal-dependent hydrolase (beta-lactamase superfamily II)
MHTPGHTEGSISLHDEEAGILYSGDTLFQGAWGRTDLPGGDDAAMITSLCRLAKLRAETRVIPGHGAATTIGDELPWISDVVASGRLQVTRP